MTTRLHETVIQTPATVDEVRAAVNEHEKLVATGGNTKSALADPHMPRLDMRQLAGVVEYDPGEYTITVLAGTRLETIRDLLAQHGQHMPFDPPWIDAGATLGGTIAAGVSGSGRQRFGSLRDFLIGVRFVDGQGRLIRGGGKVVKNAAGFDLPKLMVGSLGRLGILVEASIKVFPEPPAYGTLTHALADFTAVQNEVAHLLRSPFDLYALDVWASPISAGRENPPYVLHARLGGLAGTIAPRLAQLHAYLPLADGESPHAVETTGTEATEAQIWRKQGELNWARDAAWLVKCACSAHTAHTLEQTIGAGGLPVYRRYTNGLNSVWLAGDSPLRELHALLASAGMSGIVLRASTSEMDALSAQLPYLGKPFVSPFYTRVAQTLDPHGRFQPPVAP